jgi:hypothetical protein
MTDSKEGCRQFHTAQDVANAMNISLRQFYRLQKRWHDKRIIKAGKHMFCLGRRSRRYDLEAVLQLARRFGY